MLTWIKEEGMRIKKKKILRLDDSVGLIFLVKTEGWWSYKQIIRIYEKLKVELIFNSPNLPIMYLI